MGVGDRLVEMVVRVVYERDVDAVETESCKAFLERAADTVGAEIEDRADAFALDEIGRRAGGLRS